MDLENTVLYEKLMRIQEHITDTIKEYGSISQFKEDVLYVIQVLLEKQLNPAELTATETLLKNMENEIQKQKEAKYEEHIAVLKTELEKKDEIINEMADTISSIMTGVTAIQNQFEEEYCEFIKSDKDCCWKTGRECKDCIKEYFTRKCEGMH